MRKLLLFVAIIMVTTGVKAQTLKGEGFILGNIGYQTNYERYGLEVQGRYVIAINLRLAPNITLFFLKEKTTGLDVDFNFHDVFNLEKDKQGFSVYPLAGFGV